MLCLHDARASVDKAALRKCVLGMSKEGGTIVDMFGDGYVAVSATLLGRDVICSPVLQPLLSPPTLDQVKERLAEYAPSFAYDWRGDNDRDLQKYAHANTVSELRAAFNFLETYARTDVDEWIRMCILSSLASMRRHTYVSVCAVVIKQTKRLLRNVTPAVRQALYAGRCAPRTWPESVFFRFPPARNGVLFEWFTQRSEMTDAEELFDRACSYCVPIIASTETKWHARQLYELAASRQLRITRLEPLLQGGYTFCLEHGAVVGCVS